MFPKLRYLTLQDISTGMMKVFPNAIEKPPSAELRPDQKDSDSLPDYDQLDEILHAYVEEGKSIQTIIQMGHQEDIVRKIIRLVDLTNTKKAGCPSTQDYTAGIWSRQTDAYCQKYQN